MPLLLVKPTYFEREFLILDVKIKKSYVRIYNLEYKYYTVILLHFIYMEFFMLKKAIILFFFLSSLVFLSGEDEKVLSNIDMSKLESIKMLVEDEGMLNEWFKKTISDFIQTAKKYDKNKKLENELKNITINMLTYATVCSLLYETPEKELSDYMQELEDGMDKLANETQNSIGKMGDEILNNIMSIMSENPNHEVFYQYLDLTTASIDNYRNSK